MRPLFALLALSGFAGMVFGVVTMMQGAQHEPFSSETYGGPGSIIGGLVLLCVSLYLLSSWPKIESSTRRVNHE